MATGTLLILWTARIAFLLYAASLAGWLLANPRVARLTWTSGFCIYLAHVAAAFQFRHHWSHDAAYANTARQTADLFGIPWGGGLYFNYAFTAVWALDVIRIWQSPATGRRHRWLAVAAHTFMAFMFFNAAVVFVSSWVRWIGLTISIALAILWLCTRKKAALQHLIAILAFTASALAQDWPQFLGPARNGVYTGNDLAASWPQAGPAVIWKKEVGQGFSSPVVADGRLILFHRLGDKEVVEALDAATGRAIWKFDYPTRYRDDFGFDEGPRAAPTIAAGRVYTFGAEGSLHCLDFATGKEIWSLDTQRQFQVAKGFFGAAGAPLVDGGRVLMNIGGALAGLAAFDAATGKTLWTIPNQEASYSSPIAATIQGARHALFFTRSGLVDVDPAAGKIRYELPWRARMRASVNAATPIVVDDFVFVSASYGTGAILLQIGATGLKKIWSSDDALTNHYATSVYKDGFLYGYHGRQEEGPSLRCIDFKTGNVRWSIDSFGAGTVTLAGDKLVIVRESGELILAAANPAAFRRISAAKVVPPTVRAYPAIANGRLYIRNENTLMCLNLR